MCAQRFRWRRLTQAEWGGVTVAFSLVILLAPPSWEGVPASTSPQPATTVSPMRQTTLNELASLAQLGYTVKPVVTRMPRGKIAVQRHGKLGPYWMVASSTSGCRFIATRNKDGKLVLARNGVATTATLFVFDWSVDQQTLTMACEPW
jgi:hypothetical protein